MGLEPGNGSLPVTRQKSVTPRDQMSADLSQGKGYYKSFLAVNAIIFLLTFLTKPDDLTNTLVE